MIDRAGHQGPRDLDWKLHKPLPPKVFLMLWVLILACAWPPVATAGTLNIKAEATVKTDKDRLRVTAKAYNHGNEAAHNVQMNVMLLGEQLKSPVRTVLGVKQSETFHVEKVISEIKQGRYPVTVMVDFHDANQYPFSALVGTTFHYKKDVTPNLMCAAHDLAMKNRDTLRLEVRNQGDDPRHIRVTAVLPRELSATRPQIDFQIEPRGEKTILIEIVNSSALAGATYPVFCYLEYDLEETHYTAVAKAVVKIVRQGNWLQRTKWFWVGVAIFLGAVIVLYQFKRK